MRAQLLEYFPALERTFDYAASKAAHVLLTGYQTPAGLRRVGPSRLATWLKNRKVRGAQAMAEAAVAAAQAQHTAVAGVPGRPTLLVTPTVLRLRRAAEHALGAARPLFRTTIARPMMTTPWPPRRPARRQLPPRVAAPREPVDPARIGRCVGRRRAKGMDTSAVAVALQDAWFDARQASRYEDPADDVRGPAELAGWARIAQLLAATGPGTIYDPDVDDIVRAELAADALEAELREAVRIAARANHLQVLRDLGPWARSARPKAAKPYGTSSPGARAGASRRTSIPGWPTPWPRTGWRCGAGPGDVVITVGARTAAGRFLLPGLAAGHIPVSVRTTGHARRRSPPGGRRNT